MTKIKPVKVGDEITADLFNALIDAANAANLNVGQSCGLVLSASPDGYALSTAFPSFFWAKITGPLSGGKYPFTQQFPAASGTWTAGPLTGTAYETTGNTSVATNTYVQIWKTPKGDWRFRAPAC